MIKLVVTDIDGTLLPEGTDQLNPELFDIIRELKKKDILFVAASGRQYGSMRYLFQPVENDIFFIAENGSNVMYQGKNVSSNFMDETIAKEVVTYFRTLKECEIVLSVPENLYLERENPELLDLLLNGYHNTVKMTDDLIALCGKTNKISAYRKDGIAVEAKGIQERFASRLNTVVAGDPWIDLMDLTADKGNALQYLQKQMQISKEETMAFGDNCNDIGMLRCAAESYAVANAAPEVKKAAKYIAPSNTEDGVLQILREKLL